MAALLLGAAPPLFWQGKCCSVVCDLARWGAAVVVCGAAGGYGGNAAEDILGPLSPGGTASYALIAGWNRLLQFGTARREE